MQVGKTDLTVLLRSFCPLLRCDTWVRSEWVYLTFQVY